MPWNPISEEALLCLINEARKRMSVPERRFWDSISIPPEKWHQHLYGNSGGGFWAVGVIGRKVIWFNDIENGFNCSNYVEYGTIPDSEYWCDQHDLEWPVRAFRHLIDTGEELSGHMGPPKPGEYVP
ncbi:MAG: hypothetical protein WBP85_12925 [Terracidiphilus sp.]